MNHLILDQPTIHDLPIRQEIKVPITVLRREPQGLYLVQFVPPDPSYPNGVWVDYRRVV
jgi:hypothetical protein